MPTPGETVIQRANTFTNYAGTFLYVEAHNKGVIQTGTGNGTGRTLALSFAGADGVYGTPTQHGRLPRHRSEPRRLHVPPAAHPPDG